MVGVVCATGFPSGGIATMASDFRLLGILRLEDMLWVMRTISALAGLLLSYLKSPLDRFIFKKGRWSPAPLTHQLSSGKPVNPKTYRCKG